MIYTCDHRDIVCTMRTYTLPMSVVLYERRVFFHISGCQSQPFSIPPGGQVTRTTNTKFCGLNVWIQKPHSSSTYAHIHTSTHNLSLSERLSRNRCRRSEKYSTLSHSRTLSFFFYLSLSHTTTPTHQGEDLGQDRSCRLKARQQQ